MAGTMLRLLGALLIATALYAIFAAAGTGGSGAAAVGKIFMLLFGLGLFGPWLLVGVDLLANWRAAPDVGRDRLVLRAMVALPVIGVVPFLVAGGWPGVEALLGFVLIFGLAAFLAIAAFQAGRGGLRAARLR